VCHRSASAHSSSAATGGAFDRRAAKVTIRRALDIG
jgi:hypothetical protein